MVKIIDKLVDHLQSKFDSVGLRRQVRSHKRYNNLLAIQWESLNFSNISIKLMHEAPSNVIRSSNIVVHVQTSSKCLEILLVSGYFYTLAWWSFSEDQKCKTWGDLFLRLCRMDDRIKQIKGADNVAEWLHKTTDQFSNLKNIVIHCYKEGWKKYFNFCDQNMSW